MRLVRSVGLWRAVLARARSDWPVVLAAWLLLACATTLLATGSLYGDTVAAGAVRRALLDAPPADRAVVARTTAARAGDLEALEAPVRGAIAASLARTGGEIAVVLRSGSFADAETPPDEVTRLTMLAAHDALVHHADLAAGAWPLPGRVPVQAALSERAAAELSAPVGSRLSLVSRLDAELAVDVEVVALWRPRADDPYWAGDRLELEGVVRSDPYTTVGPVVVTRADLLRLPGRIEVQWRAIPAIDQLGVDDVEGLRRDIDQVDERVAAALPVRRQITITAALPDRLAEVGRSIVVSRSGVTLLTIQFAVLAGYAIVLVGGLLLERRRAETALLRSRGARSLHLLVMALAEGLLLGAVAIALAPFLARAIVGLLGDAGPLAAAGMSGGEISPSVVAVAVATGLAGVVALALPTVASTASLAGVRAAAGRQIGTTLPQRLGLDLALVAVAAIAVWQLRLYGAPLTRNARGVLGVDPLLVAAPAIGLLGGAVLALRIVPRLAEIGERLLERRRGLLGPLGGRQVARRPLRYTRAALLLMLAAGLATFASAHAATWTQSQRDQAAYAAAVDVRVEPGDAPVPLLAGGALRAIGGVATVLPVSSATIDLGRNVQGAPLLGLDPAVAASVVQFPATGRAAARAALERLGAVSDRPQVGVEIRGEPDRLSVVVDAAIEQVEFDEPYTGELPAEHRGVRPALVVIDADRRLHRLAAQPGRVRGDGQRLVAELLTPGVADTRPAYPLRLLAVELTLTVPNEAVGAGTVELVEVAAATASGGWRPLALDPGATPWRWTVTYAGELVRPYDPPGEAGRISVGASQSSPPLFPAAAQSFRLLPLSPDPTPVPAVVARRFAEVTGARVGQRLSASASGIPLLVEVVAVVDEFPPLDPTSPFVVLDAADLQLNRFALAGQVAEPDEWWLDVDDGRSADVVAALGRPPFEVARIVDRAGIAESLSSDPVSLGIIGALGLGAAAAMVFAAIGFVVSATVSTTERVGEFALLQALGLSRRQLAVWLSLESAFLLLVGLVAGCALGVLLAWLVLPFATLTATGAPAVPAPVVVVPWQSVVPASGLAVLLLAATVALVRRQVPSVRISGVLRARDE